MEKQIGLKYSKLVIESEAGKRSGIRYVNCICDCGNNVTTRLSSLRDGTTKSCGCINKIRLRTHGLYKHPLYMAWINIIQRTENEDSNRYYRYGARGIKMCQEWRESVVKFYEWGMNNGFEEGLQIDRIDNDGDYTPENCRFISPKENSGNRSTNIIPGGLKKLCEEKGKNYHTVYCRIKRGHNLEDALI